MGLLVVDHSEGSNEFGKGYYEFAFERSLLRRKNDPTFE